MKRKSLDTTEPELIIPSKRQHTDTNQSEIENSNLQMEKAQNFIHFEKLLLEFNPVQNSKCASTGISKSTKAPMITVEENATLFNYHITSCRFSNISVIPDLHFEETGSLLERLEIGTWYYRGKRYVQPTDFAFECFRFQLTEVYLYIDGVLITRVPLATPNSLLLVFKKE